MSQFFPASYSTLAVEALAELVSEKYGIGVVECKMILRGVWDTYLVVGA